MGSSCSTAAQAAKRGPPSRSASASFSEDAAKVAIPASPATTVVVPPTPTRPNQSGTLPTASKGGCVTTTANSLGDSLSDLFMTRSIDRPSPRQSAPGSPTTPSAKEFSSLLQFTKPQTSIDSTWHIRQILDPTTEKCSNSTLSCDETAPAASRSPFRNPLEAPTAPETPEPQAESPMYRWDDQINRPYGDEPENPLSSGAPVPDQPAAAKWVMNELDPSTSTTFPSTSMSSEMINVMAHYAAAADSPLDYAYVYTSPTDDADGGSSGVDGTIESCLTRRSSDGFSTVEPVHPLWWSKYVDVVLE